jgi:hypothetical protein
MSTLEIHPKDCSFSWEKLMEMKEQEIEFWAGDGLNRLRILDTDKRQKTIHMITHKGRSEEHTSELQSRLPL